MSESLSDYKTNHHRTYPMDQIAQTVAVITRSEKSKRTKNTSTVFYAKKPPSEPLLKPLQEQPSNSLDDTKSNKTIHPTLVPQYIELPSLSPIDLDEAITPAEGPAYFVADTVSIVDTDTLVDSEPEEGEFEEDDVDLLAITLPDFPDLRIAGIPINCAYLSISQNGFINLNLVNALRDAVQIDSGELSQELWFIREQREELREQQQGAHQESEELRITLDELQAQVDRIGETYDRILALPTINKLEFFRDSTIFCSLSEQFQKAVLDAIREKQAEVPITTQVQVDTTPSLGTVSGENDGWSPLPRTELEAWARELQHLREPEHYEAVANTFFAASQAYPLSHFEFEPNQLNDPQDLHREDSVSLSTLLSPVIHRQPIAANPQPIFESGPFGPLYFNQSAPHYTHPCYGHSISANEQHFYQQQNRHFYVDNDEGGDHGRQDVALQRGEMGTMEFWDGSATNRQGPMGFNNGQAAFGPVGCDEHSQEC
ncbi:hypothetical protein M407DRAFT_30304 [Tulasnella calospora MUT 4182]|uniref:Uncharacterized protein n=1 Tax=Tulasnella calospora MUT 4182 TaxID=1051891 RepID=A0A0C3Q7K6_9AGAM|nr:hypothetical protein M407DRAFT_30304 [Tulasnella calospora MUT 4182]